MILVDHSSISLWCLFGRFKGLEGIHEHGAREVILNAYNRVASRFKSKYGELIMCLDASDYWRKDVFPHYKAARKKTQEKNKDNWKVAFGLIRQIQEEMREHMPYRFMQVPKCEADDIIGILAPKLAFEGHPVVIVSSDKDFKQLLGNGVELYDPKEGTFVAESEKEGFLENLILRGDDGDGVPNVYSDDDVFVVKDKRQVPLVESRIKEFHEVRKNNFNRYNSLTGEWDQHDKFLADRYARNRQLVDLTQIPSPQKMAIIEAWGFERGKAMPKDSRKIMKYLISSGNGDMVDLIAGF